MKKLLSALTAGLIVSTFATTVSAEEYEVQRGDSLWSIANEYNTTVETLMDVNNLKSTVIHPKEQLLVEDSYTIQQGDSLGSIAADFDVTVSQLKDWNNLDGDLLIYGEELVITGPVATATAEQAETPAPAKKEEKVVKAASTEETSENNNPQGQTITVSATAYTAGCDGCSGVTYTGVDLNANPNAKVIAVDPDVIPLGSRVHVEGYGEAVAADIGSAIQGNRIDLHVPTKDEAFAWGVRTVNVTILD